MTAFADATMFAARLFPSAEQVPFDDQGYTSLYPIFPPFWETVIGSTASIIVFGLLYKYAGPAIRKSFADRTARIQSQLDDSAAAKVTAEAESIRIREARGDIEAERTRLHAEADAQAEALLTDGRARIEAEMAELLARADADVAAAAGRGTDELRNEIARTASTAIDRIVRDTLDDAAQQELIEKFIQRVGASA